MEHWVFWGCFGFSRGILGIFVRVPGFSHCSGCSRVFWVFRCSGVLVFLALLHASCFCSFSLVKCKSMSWKSSKKLCIFVCWNWCNLQSGSIFVSLGQTFRRDGRNENQSDQRKRIWVGLIAFSFPEPTICSVSGGIVGLWYQPLPDVVKFTTSGSACLIR